MLDNSVLLDSLKFSTLNDLDTLSLANKRWAVFINDHKHILRQRLYHLRAFHFAVIFKSKNTASPLSAENSRNWRNAPCYNECYEHYAIENPPHIPLHYSKLRLVLHTYGDTLPILFEYDYHSNAAEEVHFLHLLWHMRGSVFDEKCYLEFPLSQNNVNALMDMWNQKNPTREVNTLINCANTLSIRAYAALHHYHFNILVPCNKRVISSRVIHFTIDQYYDPPFYQQLTVPLASDVDIRCGLLNKPLSVFRERFGIDIEFEKAPIALAPNDYKSALQPKFYVKLDHVYLGQFANDTIRKTFYILLYNCYLKDGNKEMFRTYRIWSENQANTPQRS
ncbi:hypothetical protein Ddc_12103 [Ditylenchus destructor]|nr:hypothetical protein Ddc_12103 [Ditylenchus destructor]